MHSYDRSRIGSAEFFKKLDDIHLPDARWGRTDSIVLEAFHRTIDGIKLGEGVPNEVFINFEIAKNALFYSYFSYRLSMAAMVVALVSLEIAIVRKAELVSYRKGMNGLNQKLMAAFANNWIDIKHVASPINIPGDETAWLAYTEKAFIPYFSKMRNELAHELGTLNFPWRVCQDLETISKIINELFKNETVKREL